MKVSLPKAIKWILFFVSISLFISCGEIETPSVEEAEDASLQRFEFLIEGKKEGLVSGQKVTLKLDIINPVKLDEKFSQSFDLDKTSADKYSKSFVIPFVFTNNDYTLTIQSGPAECQVSKGSVTVNQEEKKITLQGIYLKCQSTDGSPITKNQCDQQEGNYWKDDTTACVDHDSDAKLKCSLNNTNFIRGTKTQNAKCGSCKSGYSGDPCLSTGLPLTETKNQCDQQEGNYWKDDTTGCVNHDSDADLGCSSSHKQFIPGTKTQNAKCELCLTGYSGENCTVSKPKLSLKDLFKEPIKNFGARLDNNDKREQK